MGSTRETRLVGPGRASAADAKQPGHVHTAQAWEKSLQPGRALALNQSPRRTVAAQCALGVSPASWDVFALLCHGADLCPYVP